MTRSTRGISPRRPTERPTYPAAIKVLGWVLVAAVVLALVVVYGEPVKP